MEYEIRFYYPLEDKEDLISKLNKMSKINKTERYYEKTIQYNSTLEGNDFYSKSIDGRYRIRITKGMNESKCIISWKKRLLDTTKDKVNKEEEIECRINPEDYDNLIYLTENIIKLERIESYERYRTNYYNDEIEISVDEYPFGLALEIEAKTNYKQKETIDKYIKLLDLKYEDSYRLSWDDKYEELCNEEGINKEKDLLFKSKNIPKIKRR